MCVCVVLESGVLLESSRVTTGLEFPTVNSLRDTAWQNVRDRATLPRNTLLQLMRVQSAGLSRTQHIISYYNCTTSTTAGARTSLEHKANLPSCGVIVFANYCTYLGDQLR